jgi:16S rRNA processing protein RimM
VARILGPFGVKGWVKLKAFTERAASLGAFDRWIVETREGWKEMPVAEFEVHSKGPVARLEGCDDRDAAFLLRGCDVAVTRGDLGEPGEGTLYWVDLVGLEVVNEDGEVLGNVEGLFESGETSVLVVKGAGAAPSGTGSRIPERMIPFVPAYVKAVDRDAKRITVDWKPDYDA